MRSFFPSGTKMLSSSCWKLPDIEGYRSPSLYCFPVAWTLMWQLFAALINIGHHEKDSDLMNLTPLLNNELHALNRYVGQR